MAGLLPICPVKTVTDVIGLYPKMILNILTQN
jgi:hypothetical protein